MTVGYLFDAFDLLNVRDLDLIEQVREQCSRVVVAVYTDAYAAGLSGRLPVVPLEERRALLQHVRGVDEVLAFDASTPVPEQSVRFVAADAAAEVVAEVLTPRRGSASPMLRMALQPLDGSAEAVA